MAAQVAAPRAEMLVQIQEKLAHPTLVVEVEEVQISLKVLAAMVVVAL
jgi:hypothetical protein